MPRMISIQNSGASPRLRPEYFFRFLPKSIKGYKRSVGSHVHPKLPGNTGLYKTSFRQFNFFVFQCSHVPRGYCWRWDGTGNGETMFIPYSGSRNGEGRTEILLPSLTLSLRSPIGLGRGPMNPTTPVSCCLLLSSRHTLIASFISSALLMARTSSRPPPCLFPPGPSGAFLTLSQNGCKGRVCIPICLILQLGHVSSSLSLLWSSLCFAWTSRRTWSMRRLYSCSLAYDLMFFSASIL